MSHMVTSGFSIVRNWQNHLPNELHHFTFSLGMYEGFKFHHILSNTSLFISFLFLVIAILVGISAKRNGDTILEDQKGKV